MKRRAGFALIGVMISFIVASMLVVSWFKTIATGREQLRMAEDRLMSEWLAEGALDRAAAKLREKAEYSGETWTISADELGGQVGAAIEIHVATVADHPDRRTIEVEAEYLKNSLRSVRVSKRIIVNRGGKS
jgi:Tfp pilus assembly protein PilX